MQYAMDDASEVCSYIDKSLMNVDATSQSGGCLKEGGKQGNMSMYESESKSKDKESSLQEDMGREAMQPPLNDKCTPMKEAP